MTDLAIISRPIASLKRDDRQSRLYADEELDRLAGLFRTGGVTTPVVIDRTGVVLAGQGTVEAARRLGLSEVPCAWIDQMDAAARSLYLSKQYRLALQAGWDEDLLVCEVRGLYEEAGPGEERRGRESAASGELAELVHEDALPIDDDVGHGPVTRPGDIWVFGRHKLMCGDPLDAATYRLLMTDDRAGLVFTDPFCNTAEPAPRSELLRKLNAVFGQLAAHSSPGSIHFICTDWRHLGVTLAAGEAVYGELKNCIVWVKGRGDGGPSPCPGHELVLAYETAQASPGGGAPVETSARYGSDVWSHAGVQALASGELGEFLMRPVVRPAALVADAISEYCAPDGIVLDAFCGSGTLLIAAERTGRRARAVEESCRSCDRSILRWQAYTGQNATLAATGMAFGEVKQQRLAGRL